MGHEFLNRLPVYYSVDFDCEAGEVWKLISKPGNLNHSHPYCKSNTVIHWEDNNHVDRLIYLNGRNYIRSFQSWDEGSGYSLLIGKEGGPQSYVVWNIMPIGDEKSKLTIIVYPFILAKLPNFIAYLPHKIWVKPRLEKYLKSVISGFKYLLENKEKVPRNYFGKHPWFS